MSKKSVNGYNLSTDNQEWLAKKGKELDRSASYFLDSIVTAQREKDVKNGKRKA